MGKTKLSKLSTFGDVIQCLRDDYNLTNMSMPMVGCVITTLTSFMKQDDEIAAFMDDSFGKWAFNDPAGYANAMRNDRNIADYMYPFGYFELPPDDKKLAVQLLKLLMPLINEDSTDIC